MTRDEALHRHLLSVEELTRQVDLAPKSDGSLTQIEQLERLLELPASILLRHVPNEQFDTSEVTNGLGVIQEFQHSKIVCAWCSNQWPCVEILRVELALGLALGDGE